MPAGLETATRWRVHDPYGEAAPQRLMQLHFAGGNRAAALQVYEAYSKMLVDEFGGKPAPEIESLAAEMNETAFHYSLAAGDAALHLFAAGDAVARYETARQLMAAGSPAQVESAVCQRLYTHLGRALCYSTTALLLVALLPAVNW